VPEFVEFTIPLARIKKDIETNYLVVLENNWSVWLAKFVIYGAFILFFGFIYRSLCDSGTVEIIGPIASSVEDVMLVYAMHTSRILFYASFFRLTRIWFSNSVVDIEYKTLVSMAWFLKIYNRSFGPNDSGMRQCWGHHQQIESV